MTSPALPFAFRSILCAVDFSATSAAALRYAAALARSSRARLSVVFAVDPLLSAAAAAAYDPRGLTDTAKTELRQFVRTTLGPSAAGRVRLLVGMGTPARTVLAIADKIRADLVVTGTHGLTGLRKVFFGSTAEGLLRRSALPVLVVPGPNKPSSAPAIRRLPDLVVLALPRSGRLGRLLQGSETYGFIHDARCPVLVMRVSPRPRGRVVSAPQTLPPVHARAKSGRRLGHVA
jgi:nucleotide-binding universal stress UspA family protein